MSGLEVLKKLYLFEGLPEPELEKLVHIMNSQVYNVGDEIFAQGDKALALYIIEYGSVKILQSSSEGDEMDIATLGSGSHFGEMAFLDDEDRSATVSALEKSQITIIDFEHLREYLANNETVAAYFYREIACFLAGRLRVTTNDLNFSKEKNIRHF